MDQSTESSSPNARWVYEAHAVDRYIAGLQSQLAAALDRQEDLRRGVGDTAGHQWLPESAEVLLGQSLLNAERVGERWIAEAEEAAAQLVAAARSRADAVVSEVIDTVFRCLNVPRPDDASTPVAGDRR